MKIRQVHKTNIVENVVTIAVKFGVDRQTVFVRTIEKSTRVFSTTKSGGKIK